MTGVLFCKISSGAGNSSRCCIQSFLRSKDTFAVVVVVGTRLQGDETLPAARHSHHHTMPHQAIRHNSIRYDTTCSPTYPPLTPSWLLAPTNPLSNLRTILLTARTAPVKEKFSGRFSKRPRLQWQGLQLADRQVWEEEASSFND